MKIQLLFENVKKNLTYVRIEGIDTVEENINKMLVDVSAVIPIGGFDKWEYYNNLVVSVFQNILKLPKKVYLR